MPAMRDDGTMLCPDILSREEYLDREKKTDPVIMAGNYQQKPYDSGDKLYPAFKTYDQRNPPEFTAIHSYTDTADKGEDYLACGVYGVTKDKMAYLFDVEYTQEGMEKTETRVAAMLAQWKCETAFIEANNGGEGFARNIGKLLIAQGAASCSVRSFHQGGNKVARILSNATAVSNSVLMPEDWAIRWPHFHRDVTRLSRAARWLHDDAPDMLTGIYEKSLLKSFAFA